MSSLLHHSHFSALCLACKRYLLGIILGRVELLNCLTCTKLGLGCSDMVLNTVAPELSGGAQQPQPQINHLEMYEI